jgi:preprotein translocase subunit SecY
MLQAFVNTFKIPDLRKKILFTLGLIAVYRFGAHIPTPGINTSALSKFFGTLGSARGGTIFGIIDMFTGGAMQNMTVFALGIMPYISASIIIQLLTTVFPVLEKLAKEGEYGRRKINQYTRYGTVILSVIQSFFISLWLRNPDNFRQVLGPGQMMVNMPPMPFTLLTILTLTTGSAFIMWLGEQIQEYGIGNGMSLLITAGIISRIPVAFASIVQGLLPSAQEKIGLVKLAVMSVMMIAVVLSVIAITQGQRKIPVQYAKRVVGRKIYGGQSTYIPLRVNHAGVMPIIFAQSIILFPATIAGFIPGAKWLQALVMSIQRGQLAYWGLYAALIIFFTYFYTAITFNPVDVSENMQKYGGFIPGIRPGRPTAEFFDFILTRISLPGAIFLAIIAVLPDWIYALMRVPYVVASFFGGTGLLIIVGVMLDTVKVLESHLLMRHYEGFMKIGRMKGRR